MKASKAARAARVAEKAEKSETSETVPAGEKTSSGNQVEINKAPVIEGSKDQPTKDVTGETKSTEIAEGGEKSKADLRRERKAIQVMFLNYYDICTASKKFVRFLQTILN